MEFFKELLSFLAKRKKLWLFPVILIMALVGFLFVLTQGTVIAPFIYTLF